MEQYIKPRWLRDLLRFLPLKSQFVLSGNVKDLQTQEIGPGLIAAAPLIDVLAAELKSAGFAHVLVYDPIAGIRFADPLVQAAEALKVIERFRTPRADPN